jgi:hypothetical protein
MATSLHQHSRPATDELHAALGSYRVELPEELLDDQGEVVDWLIGFAFDTLSAHHLDLRIVADAPPAWGECAAISLPYS